MEGFKKDSKENVNVLIRALFLMASLNEICLLPPVVATLGHMIKKFESCLPQNRSLQKSINNSVPEIIIASMEIANDRHTNVAFFNRQTISSVRFPKMFFFSLLSKFSVSMLSEFFDSIKLVILVLLMLWENIQCKDYRWQPLLS